MAIWGLVAITAARRASWASRRRLQGWVDRQMSRAPIGRGRCSRPTWYCALPLLTCASPQRAHDAVRCQARRTLVRFGRARHARTQRAALACLLAVVDVGVRAAPTGSVWRRRAQRAQNAALLQRPTVVCGGRPMAQRAGTSPRCVASIHRRLARWAMTGWAPCQNCHGRTSFLAMRAPPPASLEPHLHPRSVRCRWPLPSKKKTTPKRTTLSLPVLHRGRHLLALSRVSEPAGASVPWFLLAARSAEYPASSRQASGQRHM